MEGFPYSGLHLFTGSQGAGKTLKMMDVVHNILKEYPDVMVVSNICLHGINYFPYTGLDDFEKYDNGINGIIFIIDEIHTLFSSLESANMPVSTLTVWSQNRKNRRIILGTSQRFNRCAKGLREQCKWHIECRSGLLGFMRYRIIDASLYDDRGNLPPEERPPYFSWYVPKKEVMDSYDTGEVVRRV